MWEQKGRKLGLERNEKINEDIRNVSMELVRNNPYQPRVIFEEEKIKELAQSIKTYGLLQPIILTPEGDGYCIVAGERRFLACEMLGWTEIPAIIRDYQGSSLAAVALIENLQRENLNFMEEAHGYKRLMEEFNLTQEVLAQRLGKSQSTIANKLRLLKLPPEIKEILKEGKLTERHARALLKLNSPEKQLEVVKAIQEMELNVKEAEELILNICQDNTQSQKGAVKQRKVIIRDLRIFLNTIRQALGIIRKAGLKPLVEEIDQDEFWEIRIRLPKDNQN
ncbi:MAG: nucleoid occlusion protein [Dethiobacteria bacterium]|jgi:ParB family chromosome partitioning protein